MTVLKALTLSLTITAAAAKGYCNDRDSSCANWGKNGECEGGNADAVKNLCPHTCGVCRWRAPRWRRDHSHARRSPHTTVYIAASLLLVAPAPLALSASQTSAHRPRRPHRPHPDSWPRPRRSHACGDMESHCEAWAKSGECEKSPDYMKKEHRCTHATALSTALSRLPLACWLSQHSRPPHLRSPRSPRPRRQPSLTAALAPRPGVPHRLRAVQPRVLRPARRLQPLVQGGLVRDEPVVHVPQLRRLVRRVQAHVQGQGGRLPASRLASIPAPAHNPRTPPHRSSSAAPLADSLGHISPGRPPHAWLWLLPRRGSGLGPPSPSRRTTAPAGPRWRSAPRMQATCCSSAPTRAPSARRVAPPRERKGPPRRSRRRIS